MAVIKFLSIRNMIRYNNVHDTLYFTNTHREGKSMRERFKKLRVFICILLILALAACGKKDSDNKDNTASQNDTSSNTVNGTELAIGDFKLTIDGSFLQTSGKYDGDDTKYFGKNGGRTSLIVNIPIENHASHEATIAFLCENISAGYEVAVSDISQEKIDDDHYYLAWKGKKDGKNLNCALYQIFTQGSQLSLYELDEEASAEDIRAELTAMAQTVEYTGKAFIEKDNYYISNEDFKIKVNEGFESPQLQEASSIDPSSDTIVIDSNLISITYKNADTFNRGDSYFKINVLKDQDGDIAEIAREKGKPKDEDNANLHKDFTETTLGELWPNITDEATKALPAYKITIVIDGNDFAADSIYFNINGRNYAIGVLYPKDDETAHQALADQFYNVEFIYSGAPAN